MVRKSEKTGEYYSKSNIINIGFRKSGKRNSEKDY